MHAAFRMSGYINTQLSFAAEGLLAVEVVLDFERQLSFLSPFFSSLVVVVYIND